MEVNVKTLQEIFSPDVRFDMPLYQRRYVWNQTDQWGPLWDDVVSVAEQIIQKDVPPPHFLGAIVVMQQQTTTGDLSIRTVVDGQQRLTTLQMLIKAIEFVANEVDSPRERVRLRKLLQNDSELYEEDQLFKVWPTNVDREPFEFVMTTHMRVTPEIASSNVVKGSDWFRRTVTSWLRQGASEDRDKMLTSLVDAISQNLTVAVIDLGQSDDAQVIFETLNARGTPLLPSDLVKNYLFQRLNEHNKDTDFLYEKYWQRFDRSPWSDKDSRRVNDLIYHWTFLNSAPEEITERHIFRDFTQFVKGKDAEDIIESLDEAAVVYEKLLDREYKEHIFEGTFLSRWRAVNLRVLTPILMWVELNREDIGTAHANGILGAIESWFMRRIMLGMRSTGYTKLVYSLLGAAKSGAANVYDAILAQLLKGTGRDIEWPSDLEIEVGLASTPMYGRVNQARLRLVLEALENHERMSRGMTEQRCPPNLTIEHVMPQGWTEDAWPSLHRDDYRNALGGSAGNWGRSTWGRDGTIDRDTAINTLGNLTLVTERLNPSMSNAAWDKKRDALEKHSVLYLNRKLLDIEDWNEDIIMQRNRELAKIICKIWPRPAG